MQDAELGVRRLDKLVQVHRLNGKEDWVYIHIEIQGGRDSKFPQRMFTYNYRLLDRYHRSVASLAILADNRLKWKPKKFSYTLFGCKVSIHFPVVKLLDYADRLNELLTNDNPFALVTAAHLLTRQTRGDDAQRFAAKWRLARLLYERNWDKQRIIDLFAVIDWMMRLPAQLEKKLWHDLSQLERNKTMPYVTSVEKIGRKIGFNQGIKKGLEKGIEKGRQGEAMVFLTRLLRRRLGDLPPETLKQVHSLLLEDIETLGEDLIEFQSLFDRRNLLNPHTIKMQESIP